AQRLGELLGDSSMVERGDRIRQRASELIESAYDAEAGYYGESTTNSDPDASLFMMVNLGYLRADNPRALGHVEGLAARLAVKNGLMHRYRHDDDFGSSTSTFTVCGFWYAEALARLGRKQEARTVCDRLLGYANEVGLFSED